MEIRGLQDVVLCPFVGAHQSAGLLEAMGRERMGLHALDQPLLPKDPAHTPITGETLVQRREDSLEFWSLDLVHEPALTLSKYLAQAKNSGLAQACQSPGS